MTLRKGQFAMDRENLSALGGTSNVERPRGMVVPSSKYRVTSVNVVFDPEFDTLRIAFS